jgi:hypothetical protein
VQDTATNQPPIRVFVTEFDCPRCHEGNRLQPCKHYLGHERSGFTDYYIFGYYPEDYL